MKLKIVVFFLSLFPLFATSQSENEGQHYIFNIYFKKNSDFINSESIFQIRQTLLNIGTYNIRKINLKGYADSDHNDSFNLALSSRRAKKVYEFLLTQAVPQTMIGIESLGESFPVSEVKSLNRRVEITIFYETNSSKNSNDKNRKLIIKGKVTNKLNGASLASSIVVENNKSTFFSSSASSGKFLINTTKNSSLTFSKEGFLNYLISINDSILDLAKNDTLFLDIKLKPVEVIEKIVFEKIYFYSDSDSLKPESKPELLKLINILQSDNTILIEIQGHMNCPLSYPMNTYQKKYNNELSYKRAKAVYSFLIKNGISKSRLTYKGMSNFKMIYPEPQNEAEADKNKRVEVWKLKVIEN